ncbi:DEAD/DEAH box helicase, partial [Escherichia coli]
MLVPEISLTPQMTNRFISRFGQQVAILHSGLSDGEKYDEWRKIEAGNAQVVVGARSAIFAPLTNLGVIIIDEEHEATYKQDSNPRYHARDVAKLRADYNRATLVLGSATPSLETRARASRGV